MKEILCRGKRTDNGEWVYGNYVKKRDPLLTGVEYHFIVTQDIGDNGLLLSFVSWNKVIPETVGQFTGLLDKNGKKIFEGDIVKYSHEKTDNIALAVIKYGRYIDVDILDVNDYLGWYLEIDKNCISILSPENDGIEMEVIGNIHDNPELLEQEV